MPGERSGDFKECSKRPGNQQSALKGCARDETGSPRGYVEALERYIPQVMVPGRNVGAGNASSFWFPVARRKHYSTSECTMMNAQTCYQNI